MCAIFTVKMSSVQVSKLSSKGQITVPKKVRDAIGVRPGDAVTYEIRGKVVRLRKAEVFDFAFQAALSDTLEEWNSPEDEDAFRDL